MTKKDRKYFMLEELTCDSKIELQIKILDAENRGWTKLGDTTKHKHHNPIAGCFYNIFAQTMIKEITKEENQEIIRKRFEEKAAWMEKFHSFPWYRKMFSPEFKSSSSELILFDVEN